MNKRWLWGLIILLLWTMPVRAQDAKAGYQEARRRIEAARVSGATRLDLSYLHLEVLPPEIGQLVNLQVLDLNCNELGMLPLQIGELINLKELYLNYNHLNRLPPEISQLKNLQLLHLVYNQFTTLPPEIIQLTHLQSLDLGGNQLSNLPSEIAQLKNLQNLNLTSNLLTRLPPEIGQLTHLQSLGTVELFPALLGQPDMNIRVIASTTVIFPSLEIQQQGTEAILAYLRDYEAMQLRQTIVGIAAGVGAIAGVMLAFRWRQRRGLSEKKKRL